MDAPAMLSRPVLWGEEGPSRSAKPGAPRAEGAVGQPKGLGGVTRVRLVIPGTNSTHSARKRRCASSAVSSLIRTRSDGEARQEVTRRAFRCG